MMSWHKHKDDTQETHYEDYKGKAVCVLTISRHGVKDGKFEGYIVKTTDDCGYEYIYFKKGYKHRECVVMLAMVDYKLAQRAPLQKI